MNPKTTVRDLLHSFREQCELIARGENITPGPKCDCFVWQAVALMLSFAFIEDETIWELLATNIYERSFTVEEASELAKQVIVAIDKIKVSAESDDEMNTDGLVH